MWKIKMRICQKTHFQISHYSDYMLDITQFDLSHEDFTVVTLPTASSLSGFPFNIELNNSQCSPGPDQDLLEGVFLPVPDPAFVSGPLLILQGFTNCPSPSTHWLFSSLWLAYRFFHCTFSMLFGGAKCKHTSLLCFQIGANEINEIKNLKIRLLTKWAVPSLSEPKQLAGKQVVELEWITFLLLLRTCWRC